jgi:hypothetical protein
MIPLFHVREKNLPLGSLIKPGRWGATVLRGGKAEPFFFREHLLEIWRRERTSVVVSRFNCTFAFESQEQAYQWAAQGEFVLPVIPVDQVTPRARLDMLWLTWMGEPHVTTDKIAEWCAAYWAGRCTTDVKPGATPWWEWLFACPLKVT